MSVSTITDNAPLDPDDELLVSYLDGELKRQEQSDLESRLLTNEKLRARLQQLQTGWDLLEDLPRSSPSMKLVESTLELVVADILKDQPAKAASWKRWQVPCGIALLCLLAGFTSYAIESSQRSNAYQKQLEDLVIAGNINAYNYGGNLKLMRQLSADKDWAQMIAASTEIGDIRIDTAAVDLIAAPVAQRESALQAMALEQMDQLNSRWEQFTRLNKADQERIRITAESVAQQPDAELLMETMQAYAIWRQTLPPELRDQIESSNPTDRRNAIKQAVERTYFSISKRSSLRLDDETIDWINFSLDIVLKERIEGGDKITTAYYEDLLSLTKLFSTARDAKQATIATIVFGGSRGPTPGMNQQTGTVTSQQPRPGGSNRRNPSVSFFSRLERPAPLSPSELNTIKVPLPDTARNMLNVVALGNPLIELATIKVWCEETVRRHFLRRFDDNLDLEERYEHLTPERQNRVDLLPPEDFLREMSRPRRGPR